MARELHQWMDQYPILDPEHIHDLETRAAVHEFMGRLPRHEAQAKAHEDYQKDHITEAAAHHLIGLQTAHAAGAKEEARKHGMLYALAMKKLGHDPVGEPPPEVSKKAKDLSATSPVHRFKAHKADVYTMPPPPGNPTKP